VQGEGVVDRIDGGRLGGRIAGIQALRRVGREFRGCGVRVVHAALVVDLQGIKVGGREIEAVQPFHRMLLG
jgi:hypothetical protein